MMPMTYTDVFSYFALNPNIPGILDSGVYLAGLFLPTKEEIDIIISRAYSHINEAVNNQQNNLLNELIRENNIVNDFAERLFVVLDVGESQNISIRLNEKYGEIIQLDALFDLTMRLPCVYYGIKTYNKHWVRKPRVNRRKLDLRYLNLRVNENVVSQSLLFLSHPNFINQLFPGIAALDPSLAGGVGVPLGGINISQDQLTVGLLNILIAGTYGNPAALIEYLIKVTASRIIYRGYYAFAFSNCPVDDTLHWEAAIKNSLERDMDLYTMKDRNGGLKVLGNVLDLRPINNVIYNPLSINPLLFPV